MKILCLRNVSIAGQSYAAGEVADVPEKDALQVISIRKAVPHVSKSEPEVIETREPEVVTRDPVVKKSKLPK